METGNDACTTQAASPIDASFSGLSNELDMLQSRLDVLCDKLSPILPQSLPSPGEDCEKAQSGDPGSSSIVKRVCAAKEDVTCQINRINNVIQRLEL